MFGLHSQYGGCAICSASLRLALLLAIVFSEEWNNEIHLHLDLHQCPDNGVIKHYLGYTEIWEVTV